jgi:hypothetical protein
MADQPSCRICGLPIEIRYGVAQPRSTSLGYWTHLKTEEGMAAEKDHEASRRGRCAAGLPIYSGPMVDRMQESRCCPPIPSPEPFRALAAFW